MARLNYRPLRQEAIQKGFLASDLGQPTPLVKSQDGTWTIGSILPPYNRKA